MTYRPLEILLRSRNLKMVDLARALGVQKSTVSRWATGKIPVERLIDVERATGIPRHELRPDIFGETEHAA